MPDYCYEEAAAQKGFLRICGVDEAGRGPLAGPVCAAAVILPTGLEIAGLNDSKKLSPKKRDELYEIITEKSLAWSVAYAEVEEIELHNILGATFLAMNRAIECLSVVSDYAIIDGNRVPKAIKVPCETVVKGDFKCMSVAAASILAKVSRDRLMDELDEKYPVYNFKKHKGYGTAEHMALIREHGPCSVHRLSFLTKL